MFKQAKRLIFLYIVMPVIGIILLCVAYAFPTENILENVLSSSDYVYNAQSHINNVLPDTSTDRWTNSLIVNEAICETEESIFIQALKANYYITGELWEDSPYETLISILNNDMDSLNISSYERYWHGYLVILKPLLYLFTLTDVVYINIIFQFVLLFFVIYLLGKIQLKQLIFPYLVFYVCLSPATIAYSFQYSSIYYITQISVILLLLNSKYLKERNLYLCFFTVIGMSASYFDLLTYPIVSLGIPLIVLLMIEDVEIWSTIKYSAAWAIGYVEMWASKWILGSIFLNEDLIHSAIGAVKSRSSSTASDGTDIDCVSVLAKNFQVYNNLVYKIILLLVIFWILVMLLFHLKKKSEIKITQIVTLFGVAFYPVIWYIVIQNHSYIHSWMTFRNLSIFFMAFAGIAVILSEEYFKNRKTQNIGERK